MSMTTEEVVGLLNGLIEVSKNGEIGYLTAARDVKNSQLTSIFNEYAKQRAAFARELQTAVERLGGEAGDSGTVSGVVHRGWMDLKSVLSGGDGGAIIAACETGEDSASAAYERVVNADLTGHTKTLVEKQWHKVQEAHQHLLRLKAEVASGVEYPHNE